MQITVGADPELAIVNGSKFVPCLDKIKGTKSDPFAVEGSKCGLKIQEDNVALEFNVMPSTVKNFSTTINTALKELHKVVADAFGPGHSYIGTDSALFTAKQLEHPKAQTFGCDPDFLAHARGAKRMPLDPKKMGNTRFFGGHIHIGYDKQQPGTPNYIPEWAIVQGMDVTYMLDVVDGVDQQAGRRNFYGLAGLFRPKSYGLEYRTPSPYWLSNLQRAQRIINAAQAIVSRPTEFRRFHQQINWPVVQSAIDTGGRITGAQYDAVIGAWDDFSKTPEEV